MKLNITVYEVECPLCGAEKGETCFRNGKNKIYLSEPHKKRIFAADCATQKLRNKWMGEDLKYEPLISPANMEEIIKEIAQYDKDMALGFIYQIGMSIGSDERTFAYSDPIEELMRGWVEDACKNN